MKIDETYSYLRSFFSVVVGGQPNLVIVDAHFFEAFQDRQFLEVFKLWLEQYDMLRIVVYTKGTKADLREEVLRKLPVEVKVESLEFETGVSTWFSLGGKAFELNAHLTDYIIGKSVEARFLEIEEIVQKLGTLKPAGGKVGKDF
ncbi:MAG: hypothetical protein LBD38_03220 [Streptococcaceae bacterium]|jgi:hypothetical protein|nr:hypothetical protein [Streptococcaceae bacterium]